MLDDRLDLDRRPPGMGPMRVQMIAPGGRLSEVPPTIGTEVLLRVGDVHIAVQVESIIGAQYTAEVTGFEGWDEMAYKGVQIGDRLEFEESNIFSYSL